MLIEHRILHTTLIVFSSVISLMQTASTEAAEDPWQLRVTGLAMNLTGSSVVVDDTRERIPYDAVSGYGFGLDFEYRVSTRLGIDFGILTADPEIEVSIEDSGGVTGTARPRITPMFAALNIHLTPASPFDLYLGPMLAYVMYSDFELTVDSPMLSERFDSSNDFGYGINIGLDIRFGESGWFLTGSTKYLVTNLETASSDGGVGRTDLDPWIFGVGFGRRF